MLRLKKTGLQLSKKAKKWPNGQTILFLANSFKKGQMATLPLLSQQQHMIVIVVQFNREVGTLTEANVVGFLWIFSGKVEKTVFPTFLMMTMILCVSVLFWFWRIRYSLVWKYNEMFIFFKCNLVVITLDVEWITKWKVKCKFWKKVIDHSNWKKCKKFVTKSFVFICQSSNEVNFVFRKWKFVVVQKKQLF